MKWIKNTKWKNQHNLQKCIRQYKEQSLSIMPYMATDV